MLESFLLKVRRGETPFYRRLKNLSSSARTLVLPVPRFLYPLFGFVFESCQRIRMVSRWLVTFFFIDPLFRSRCASVGKRFRIWRMPFIVGHTKIYIGDDVNFFGQVDIFSGRLFDEPKLIIGNRVDIGHGALFIINKEVVIEDDVNIASGVRFFDTDAHPRDTADRIADLPPRPEEVKPVRIGRYSWIGHNVFIMKGVTIGEGAVIGVNSVVVSDIPPYSVAMGNPARVVVKNVSKPVTPSAVEAKSAIERPAATEGTTATE
jgi:acetyltransferase-like isoleucine patch superfamily enzyme